MDICWKEVNKINVSQHVNKPFLVKIANSNIIPMLGGFCWYLYYVRKEPDSHCQDAQIELEGGEDNIRYSPTLIVPYARTNSYFHSFFPSTLRHWNTLY